MEALLEAPLKRLDPRQSAPLAPSTMVASGAGDTSGGREAPKRPAEERSRNDDFADGNSGYDGRGHHGRPSDVGGLREYRDDRDGRYSRRDVSSRGITCVYL